MVFVKFAEYRFRILAGVLLVIFLVSTWFLFLQQPKYPEELHLHLQEQLKNLIKNRLHESNPALIDDLTFDRVHTEATKQEGQIKAHFQYAFIDKQRVKTVVQGTAMIYRRILESSDDHELWVVTDFQTNSTLLDFEEPVTLLPSSQSKGELLEAVDSDVEESDGGMGNEDMEDSSSSWENTDTQPEEAASEREKVLGRQPLEPDEIVRTKKVDEGEEQKDDEDENENVSSEEEDSRSDDQENSSEPATTGSEKTNEGTNASSENNAQSEAREDTVEEADNTIEAGDVNSNRTEEDSSGSVDSVTE